MPTEDIATLLETRRFRVVRTRRRGEPTLLEREVIRHPGSVVLVPMLDDGRVCLIRNFRLSVDQELIELPAGTLDPGEDPQTTALRELTEETGFHAARITLLCDFYVAPGNLDERMFLFLAEGLSSGATHHQPDEEIQNLVVPWPEAIQMALDGRICDAKTLLGLLYYDRLRTNV